MKTIKKMNLLIILLFYCFSFPLSAQFLLNAVSVNSEIPENDPNADKNWDWTQDVAYTLYISGINPYPTVSLPYFQSEGPAGVFNYGRDMQKEKGWVLLYRDFGTRNRNISMPRILLYNTYTGTIRFFFFNRGIFQQDYTYCIASIEHSVGREHPASFTFFTTENVTLGDYNAAVPQTVICKIQSNQWCFVDFNVMGFDPHINEKKDASFTFKFVGVQESNLILSGNIKLEQVIGKNTNSVSFFGAVQQGDNILLNGVKNFKDGVSLLEGFKDEANKPEKKNEWWAPIARSIIDFGPVKYAPLIGSIAGFVDAGICFVNALFNEPSQPVPLKFQGDIKLDGKIELRTQGYLFTMRVPGAPFSDPVSFSNSLPLYDKPLGIFNLKEKPIVLYRIKKERWEREEITYYLWYSLQKNLEYELNSASGLQLHSFQVAYIGSKCPLTPYYNISDINTTTVEKIVHRRGAPIPEIPSKIACMVKLLPINNPSDTLLVLKTYSVQQTTRASMGRTLASENALDFFTSVEELSIIDFDSLVVEEGIEYTYLRKGNMRDYSFSESFSENNFASDFDSHLSAPTQYTLLQNYPNPFNPTTNIEYQLPTKGFVTLKVYDVLGKEIATLVQGEIDAGIHTVTFNANALSSGVYIYRLQTPETILNKRMVIMK